MESQFSFPYSQTYTAYRLPNNVNLVHILRNQVFIFVFVLTFHLCFSFQFVVRSRVSGFGGNFFSGKISYFKFFRQFVQNKPTKLTT